MVTELPKLFHGKQTNQNMFWDNEIDVEISVNNYNDGPQILYKHKNGMYLYSLD
jgi:hypothetical protein